MNQSAVVQYALEPLAVELREVVVPEIGDDDVLLKRRGRVGVRVRRPPGVQHAVLAGERAGHARARVRRHGRENRPRREELSRRRSRRVRDGRRRVRRVPAVPDGPLQPVSGAQGIRLRHQRRDGVLRQGPGALPAPHSRLAAVRPRVPRRAALGRLQRDVRQLDDPSGRSRRGPRSRADRTPVRADGGAGRRRSADRRRSVGRCRQARDRDAARRDARDRTPRPKTSRRSSAASVRSAPISCATRRARAGRSISPSRWRVPTAR